MKPLIYLALAPVLLVAADRPKILGIAHVNYYVTDLAKARGYYENFLGYAELPFTLKRPDGSDRIAYIKINDDQYLELSSDPRKDDGQFGHVAFYTDDADRARDYLVSKNVAVTAIQKGSSGNKFVSFKDPDGHTVEILEYLPDSKTSALRGKFMPDSRISTRIMHTGMLIGSLSRALAFYRDILGFEETWRGTGNPERLSWVNLRVPDGPDYIEFMLYSEVPAQNARGAQNHIALMVPDMAKAVAELESRPAAKDYSRKIEPKTGVNQKRQANLFDPDGTRSELMEPKTVTGKPTPSSTAPPPLP